ncbi:MAG: hypothetical protein IKR48_05490 [Kiritimatiellae bacterium]|nr:hypothetical protein [Kiritimatiellia bacterium]
MGIDVVTFDLSMKSPETGEYLTARTYTVDGVYEVGTSTLRQLSIGQLVMAICLQRASVLEADIIRLMDEMNTTSSQLEAMTEIEQQLVDWADQAAADTSIKWKDLRTNYIHIEGSPYNGKSYYAVLTSDELQVMDDSYHYVRYNGDPDSDDIMYDDLVTKLEAKMDEKNSFSQQKMIELQSQTSKRDQTYDMISNILKSINQVMTGNVNNM